MKKLNREITDPQNLVFIICGLIALATGLYAIICMPAERHVSSLGIFCFKLLPFIFGAITIASFKREYCDFLVRTKIALLMVIMAFLIYFGVFVPEIFNAMQTDNWNELYYTVLMEVAYIILFTTFVFRIAGGTSSSTLRLSFSLLVIMVSGIEDLMFHLINKYPIPDLWDWATHIKVRIGHYPTKYEAFAFIILHCILALLIIFVPWGKLKPYKWIEAKVKNNFTR